MTKVQNPLERVVKYEYDEANNLINEVSEYGLKEHYTYDNEGNMTSLTKNDGSKIEYTYDALGRKLSEGSRTFEYDPYDNLIKAIYKGKVTEYTYDNFDHITSVNDANNNVVEYKWDIYGNKTELKYKDKIINYTYNEFNKIDKVQNNGEDYAIYTYDARGNTVDVLSGFGYNGERLDESGNIYLRARYYNPRINQFIQIDSYRGEQGNTTTQQRYTYCANNQYKYVDPSGHFIFAGGLILGGIFGVIGVGGLIGAKAYTDKKLKEIEKEKLKSTTKNSNSSINDSIKTWAKTTVNTAKKTVEAETCKKPASDKALDILQFIIDLVGIIPIAGDICDAVNCVIYYLRTNYIDAICSLGSVILSVVGDAFFKGLKWATNSAVELAKKILYKFSDFSSRAIKYLKGLPNKIKGVPIIGYAYNALKSGCDEFVQYIDDIFGRALSSANGAPLNSTNNFVQNITSNAVLSHSEKLSNLLKKFKSKVFKVDKISFMLDKEGLQHILERHLPSYWNGTIKAAQTFFDKNMTINEITDAIYTIFMQNRDIIAQKWPDSIFAVVGSYKGNTYQLGFNKGKIMQFYPK